MVNNKLKNLFTQYKNYIVAIINELEAGYFDSLETLFKSSQEVLDLIDKGDHTMKELVLLYDELEIKVNQDKIERLIMTKRDFIKNELKIIAKANKAKSQYNRQLYENTRVFSKKI